MRPANKLISIPCALALAALAAVSGRASADTGESDASAVAPACPRPSHERLIVREGRDVCGASLNRSGRPMAMGYLPTVCPRESDVYQIDAVGRADRCLRRPSVQGEKS